MTKISELAKITAVDNSLYVPVIIRSGSNWLARQMPWNLVGGQQTVRFGLVPEIGWNGTTTSIILRGTAGLAFPAEATCTAYMSMRVPDTYDSVKGLVVKSLFHCPSATGNVYVYHGHTGTLLNEVEPGWANNIEYAAYALTPQDKLVVLRATQLSEYIRPGDFYTAMVGRIGGDENDNIDASVDFWGWQVEFTTKAVG